MTEGKIKVKYNKVALQDMELQQCCNLQILNPHWG